MYRMTINFTKHDLDVHDMDKNDLDLHDLCNI